MLNNPNEWHNIEEDTDQEQEFVQPANTVQAQETSAQKGIIIIAAAVILLIVLIVSAVTKMKSKKADVPVMKESQEQLADQFYNEASSNAPSEENNDTAVIEVDMGQTDPIAEINQPETDIQNGVLAEINAPISQTKSDLKQNKSPEGDTVLVSIGGGGRENPFMPAREKKPALPALSSAPKLSYGNVPFEVIEPPSLLNTYDEKAEQLMETTISGIMYDNKNPSAIININGTDQLVRKGDKLLGFTILDITKDKVVIKEKTNIYRASVGQSIATEGLNFNDIANLKKKFGGAYSTTNINSIEIKAN